MMNQDELNKILAEHKVWLRNEGGSCADLRGADLSRADLRGADLRNANLWGANLRDVYLWGANLDFSCLPLWCGSKGVIVDKRIAAQIAAHFCALTCDDPDYQAARSAILEFAKTSHRAGELGLFQQTPIISDKYSEREHTLSKDCWCNPTIVNKNGYEYPASTRVRCTKDGEYPEDENQIVLAEFEGKDFTDLVHIVGFDYDNAQWIDFDSDEIIPNVPEEMTVYWRPLTSLKAQYERERGE